MYPLQAACIRLCTVLNNRKGTYRTELFPSAWDRVFLACLQKKFVKPLQITHTTHNPKFLSGCHPQVQHRPVSFPASLNWKQCLSVQSSLPEGKNYSSISFQETVLLKEMCIIWDTTYAYADMIFKLKE